MARTARPDKAPRALCHNCKQLKILWSLGLCMQCYNQEVRTYNLDTTKRDNNSQPTDDCEPTSARPGTIHKLRVMIERYQNNQPIFHPRDKVTHD